MLFRSKAKNALDKTGVKEEEEVTFSQEEIDHINSFFLEASVAPNRPEVATGADSTSDKMSQNDVTGTAESGKKRVKEEVEINELEGGWYSRKQKKPKSEWGIKDRNKWRSEFHNDPSIRFGKNFKKKPEAEPKDVKEDTLDEGGMPASVIAHKQKLANMSDKEFSEKYGHKPEKELRDMAARHGYGWDKATKTGSDHYVRRVASTMKEETLEEGRPKKNPTPETTERDPRKHIQVEAGRAAAGNVIDFHHNDGSKSKITPAMGRDRKSTRLNSTHT